MIKVIFNKACACCVQSEPLTSGMVGQTIQFEYSHDFDGLTVTAVFTNGKETVDVINPGAECTIPHEILDTAGAAVSVGVYATKGADLVIPTVYARIGVVLRGADPGGDVEADPTLPIWAQLQAMIGDLSDLETEAKANLVAAINEAAQTGGGGSGGTANIALRVEGGYIQYTVDGKTWTNLIAIADLKGAPGTPGANGFTPHIGDNGNWYLGNTDTGNPSRGPQGNPGKNGAGMDITSATVGQIAKISAVDDNGVPTAWEPVDMPGGGGDELQWIKVAFVVTEEETNVLSIGTDGEGREISGYHPLAMIVCMTVPSDSTQASTNGTIWAYPSNRQINTAFRIIQGISNWKTTLRSMSILYCGRYDSFASNLSMSGTIVDMTEDSNVLSGVYMCIQAQGDHFPIGTKVNVAVLSKGWSE